MSLLGKPLVIVLALFAALVPVGTVLLWNRTRGPRAVRVVARLAMLGVCELTGVLLVAALANDYGQFYSSWDDLFGTVGGNYKTTVYGAAHVPPVARPMSSTTTSAAAIPDLGTVHIGAPTSWAKPWQRRTRGEVLHVSVTGRRSHLRNEAFVYLPPQYFAAQSAHRHFPAVEVLTGYPGAASNLMTRMDYPGVALSLNRSHRAAPAVYVMLSSTVAAPRDTECTDIPGGPKAETFLGEELPSAIDHGFRVRPNDWGVMGDSTGGYCAAKIAMYHRNSFTAGVSLSGYYYARSDWTTGNLWGGSSARRHHNDLEWMLAHRPAPAVPLYVTISKQESGRDGYRDTVRFLKLVRPPMQVTAHIAPAGGHNFTAWDRELPGALTWLSHRLLRHEPHRQPVGRHCRCSRDALGTGGGLTR